jgi:hypothetical protein
MCNINISFDTKNEKQALVMILMAPIFENVPICKIQGAFVFKKMRALARMKHLTN